jgi:neutral ceramidase
MEMRRMLKLSSVRLFLGFACGLIATDARLANAADELTEWKAGVASVVITPEQSTWMAGYAARTKPSEGKAQDLFAKALALQDSAGTRLVIVTTDLIGITRPMRDYVVEQARQKYQLPPEALLMNSSHTHCGPVVRVTKSALYALDDEQKQRVETYVAGLHDKLVQVVGQALGNLAPAKLGYSHARAGFAMNRRLPTDKGPQNSPYPDGPVDHDVPVLRIEGADGKLRGILFGYACHNTTLGFFQFCGDYAGYAQEYLEEAHPGTTALFFMGCGGDQNPYPRGSLELARQHGRTLATAVEAALLPQARPIHGPLRSAMKEVSLEFAPPPSREELERATKSPNKYEQKHAQLLLDELNEHGKIRSNYPYPVQVAQLGNDLTIIALAGEVVIDYSLRLKREVSGTTVWMAGYSNDVFAYIPSLRVLKEGGYEGGGAVRHTTLPGAWDPNVEEQIVGTVHELVRGLKTGAAK